MEDCKATCRFIPVDPRGQVDLRTGACTTPRQGEMLIAGNPGEGLTLKSLDLAGITNLVVEVSV